MIVSPAKERARKRSIIGAMILVGIIAIAGALGYLYLTEKSKVVKLNKSNLCPLDGPTSVTAVLVDRSDKLNVYQKESLRAVFQEIKNMVPKFGLLEIYILGEIADRLATPVLSICNPGRGDDISYLTGNPRLATQRWENEFSKKIDSFLPEFMGDSPSSNSPIMENIHSVSITSKIFRMEESVPKQLILISDLLQNSSILSQYKNFGTYKDFLKNPNSQSVQCNLKDFQVTIYYLRRPKDFKMQGKDHISFWRDYLSHMGATLGSVNVKSIN
jgi:hypothetical protein